MITKILCDHELQNQVTNSNQKPEFCINLTLTYSLIARIRDQRKYIYLSDCRTDDEEITRLNLE